MRWIQYKNRRTRKESMGKGGERKKEEMQVGQEIKQKARNK